MWGDAPRRLTTLDSRLRGNDVRGRGELYMSGQKGEALVGPLNVVERTYCINSSFNSATDSKVVPSRRSSFSVRQNRSTFPLVCR